MKLLILFFILTGFCIHSNAQITRRQLPATRTSASFKIDGIPDEEAWRAAVPLDKLVEWRPDYGKPEYPNATTTVYLLYDNTSIYIGGICREPGRDSISKELVGRDVVGVNDYVGVIFDTYNDKINGFGFYVTPHGEQFDAKYSITAGEDGSWSAVWQSEANVTDSGWTFEMKIPYSAIRFVSKENQTWGLNFTRNRKKAGRQYMWNPIDPAIGGFMNQSGEWTGIEKIVAPVRLSFSPYFSTYLNHYPSDVEGVKDLTSSANGGMDLKYGISDAFTLDMTLVPDFGQVQSDNVVLNLSPFEIQFNENRQFFNEGTELFSKGNLFYSRRIGSTPIHYGDVYGQLQPGEKVLKNPQDSRLLNATKISGRTQKGLGVGFFNAITKPMYAEVEDANGGKRKLPTNPLTNYNIIVFDQTLKNNSSVSLINTNVWRSGPDRDANVTAGVFDFNNKSNTYNMNGKVAVSQLMHGSGQNTTGYSHNIGFNKTGGRLNFSLMQELTDHLYDINDMGILFNNNYLDHYFWTGYRWLKPGKWFNRMQYNFNFTYSRIFREVPDQKFKTNFQTINTNINGNVQFKNLWWAGFLIAFNPEGNNFYESHEPGWIFRTTKSVNANLWFESNFTKKYYYGAETSVSFRQLFNGRNTSANVWHRYRFSDKFSLDQQISFNSSSSEAGFYDKYYEPNNGDNPTDIIFSRRNRETVENVLGAKYNFNNKSGINFRARHYWSRVVPQELFDLQDDGSLAPTSHSEIPVVSQNFNAFNIDAVYTWQFRPGSFLNIVWKNSIYAGSDRPTLDYFGNLHETMGSPQNNSISIKLLYFIDYLDFKKKS